VSAEDRHVHDGCGEDAAPYVLGALSEAEHEAFAAHLRGCATCREEVTSLQAVAGTLPSAVPQLSAPAPLRDRVMATVQSEATLRTAGAGGTPVPGRGARQRSWRLAFGGVAATAVVALLAVLAFGGGSGSATRVYHANVTAPSATATLRVDSGHGTLQIAGMPKTPPGKVYEVWLERSGRAHPTDALFTVSSAGRATVAVPGALNGVQTVMVTAEPGGGSSVPTSSPVIVARIG
jgi:anti-sigma-K factor RskA